MRRAAVAADAISHTGLSDPDRAVDSVQPMAAEASRTTSLPLTLALHATIGFTLSIMSTILALLCVVKI